jgi:YbbR domain-containing protein
MSISLSNDYYTTIDLPVKLTDFPEGYSSGTKLPQNITVKMKGKGWKLVGVQLTGESEYIVSAKGDSGRKYVNLYSHLSDNQWLSSDLEIVDISPDTLSFFVERIKNKKINIVPALDISFRAGYGLATSIKISPDSTVVYGPGSVIDQLEFISTELLIKRDLDEKISERIPLVMLPGVRFDNAFVTISLDVQKIVDKDFDNLPVQVIDVPRDRDVVLLPNKVSVNVRGGIDILGKITNEDIKVKVNYRDVVLDTLGSVAPLVELPANTTLVSIKPKQFRYIIKKFN